MTCYIARAPFEAFDADQITLPCEGTCVEAKPIPALSAVYLAMFWERVDRRSDDECWPWLGNKDSKQRGKFSIKGSVFKAPRVMWAIANGQDPRLHVLHDCDNPNCVNPAHLSIGTQDENMKAASGRLRWAHLQREFCKHGHPLSGDNLYVRKDGRGRACRACWRLRDLKRRRPS